MEKCPLSMCTVYLCPRKFISAIRKTEVDTMTHKKADYGQTMSPDEKECHYLPENKLTQRRFYCLSLTTFFIVIHWDHVLSLRRFLYSKYVSYQIVYNFL